MRTSDRHVTLPIGDFRQLEKLSKADGIPDWNALEQMGKILDKVAKRNHIGNA